MGTWGAGNRESDGALDELAERSNALVKQLWERAQTQESWEADEYEYDALFVDFETLFALEDAGVFNGWNLATPDQVEPVRAAWLSGWDGYFDGLAPKEGFKASRRAVIETTWQRFIDICSKYAAERDG